ncbi:hypothetical protein V9T40_000671 [Parthenolecanium corni]|uniref:F-box domain-containing protein n=1 Tax=Parthenolecanium corni TaxID=536013 RepID=A0AAN9TMS9_9HEMI
MYCHKLLADECGGLQPALPTGPILTVLPAPVRAHRTHRYHPFTQQPPLYQPHRGLPKERSPSPIQLGTHISRLYPELLAIIFSYLEVPDKGRAAQVCQAWRDASYHKSVWRGVEAKLHLQRRTPTSLTNSLNRRGIRRIQILSVVKSFKEITRGVSNLTSLNLSGCYNVRDDNLYQAFATAVPTLVELNLSMCKQITDKCLLKIIPNVVNLETLELGGCSNLTDASVQVIASSLRRLKYLNLRSCWGVSDHGVRLLSGQSDTNMGLPMLEKLGLQDCQHLSDDALKYVSAGLPQVRSINLCFCVNISDMSLRYLARMSSLRDMNLGACDNISDAGIAFLAEAGSPITSLDLSFCEKITDQSLDYMAQGLFNLKRLSLKGCPVSDDGLTKIAKGLAELEVLNVGQCKLITDQSLRTAVESLKNLRSVDLYGCPKITNAAVKEIKEMVSPECVINLFLS